MFVLKKYNFSLKYKYYTLEIFIIRPRYIAY